MKRLTPWLLLSLTLTLVVAPFAGAASPASAGSDRSPAVPLAAAVSTVTGLAISLLLGTDADGADQRMAAKPQLS